METINAQRVLFARRWRLAASLGAVLAVALLAVALHRGSAPPSTPAAGLNAPAGSGWPALAIPRGEGGLRVRLFISGGLLVPGTTPRAPGPAMQKRAFRLISIATRRVWRLRTDASGRAQLAVPPGRYELRLDWTNTGGPVWKLNVRAGQTLTRRLVEATL